MTQADDQGLNRFAELVAAYGARPRAWPEAERAWARALLETSSEARRIASGAEPLDHWLDAFTAPEIPSDLGARILARAPAFFPPEADGWTCRAAEGPGGMLRRWRARLNGLPLWAPVARPVYAAACAALFGLLLGWGGVFSQSAAAGEEEEILALALVGSELESYDLGEMR